MLKTLIRLISNTRGTDDDYYFLVFDEETGAFLVEHSWHYWSPRKIDQGERTMTLSEAKQKIPGIYQEAVELIKSKLFSGARET